MSEPARSRLESGLIPHLLPCARDQTWQYGTELLAPWSAAENGSEVHVTHIDQAGT